MIICAMMVMVMGSDCDHVCHGLRLCAMGSDCDHVCHMLQLMLDDAAPVGLVQ